MNLYPNKEYQVQDELVNNILLNIPNFKNVEEAITALKSDYFLINHLTDNDLYKFTMQQFAFHQQKDAVVKYRFKCRNKIDLRHIKDILLYQIKHYCDLTFTKQELEFLKSTGHFKADYLRYLETFKHDLSNVKISIVNNELMIEIYGKWTETILMEVPFLAMVNGIFSILEASKGEGIHFHVEKGVQILHDKIAKLKEAEHLDKIKIMEFGVRRRFLDVNYQEIINRILIENIPENFLGVSNVYLAMKLNVKPFGTMAHEYLQAYQAIATPETSQAEAFKAWLKEYNGTLDIALSDIFGDEAFFADFNKELAETYSGLRQDSGDPVEYGYNVIKFYKGLGINPLDKKIVFSDSLNVDLIIKIINEFHDKIQVAFGIGTNLTNDVGLLSLSIVIKMTKFNNKDVAKLSNDISKSMCENEEYFNNLVKIVESKKYPTIFQ